MLEGPQTGCAGPWDQRFLLDVRAQTLFTLVAVDDKQVQWPVVKELSLERLPD